MSVTVEERQRSQIFEHCSLRYLDPPLSLLQLYAVPKSRETWLWVRGERCQAMIGNRVPLLARAWCPVVRQLVEQSGRSAGLVLGCWVSGGGEVSGCDAPEPSTNSKVLYGRLLGISLRINYCFGGRKPLL